VHDSSVMACPGHGLPTSI